MSSQTVEHRHESVFAQKGKAEAKVMGTDNRREEDKQHVRFFFLRVVHKATHKHTPSSANS